jgi:hypothetical protein
MELRQLLQPMMNELALATEKMEKELHSDGMKLNEHVYGWFLIKLETKIKRFVMDQERFNDHG